MADSQINGVATSQSIAPDRATRTLLASWTGAMAVDALSQVASLIHRTNGLLADAFVIDWVTNLNGGTMTSAGFTVELSWDGINWLDSGADAVTATGAGVHVIVLSLYQAPKSSVLGLLPARFVRVRVKTAVVLNAGTAQTFEIGITLR
jgi:hypothetical protein